jgi:uncharacterized protein
MIVGDTGAVLALLDADDAHHDTLVQLLNEEPGGWILPWAILPEVDYVARSHLGDGVARSFVADLASGAFAVEWGVSGDLGRARDLVEQYRDLELGLVDAVVITVAERLGAGAIATLDLRDFGAVEIRGSPRLLPRDL